MPFSYSEFKDYVQKREFEDFRSLQLVIKNLEEFYEPEKDFKFFYPKNIFNSKELELLIFFVDGYLSIKKDSNRNWDFEHFRSKVICKKLLTTKELQQELRISFENGNEIILNNLLDSNFNWEVEYSTALKDLYKII